MTLDEYQSAARRTQRQGITKADMLDHARSGMTAENGEISSIYQKVYQGHPLDETKLKKETGDLLWFISEFCDVNGWSLDEIAQANLDKLRARYPAGFDPERSVNRDE